MSTLERSVISTAAIPRVQSEKVVVTQVETFGQVLD